MRPRSCQRAVIYFHINGSFPSSISRLPPIPCSSAFIWVPLFILWLLLCLPAPHAAPPASSAAICAPPPDPWPDPWREAPSAQAALF